MFEGNSKKVETVIAAVERCCPGLLPIKLSEIAAIR
jgi:hypothetical protein